MSRKRSFGDYEAYKRKYIQQANKMLRAGTIMQEDFLSEREFHQAYNTIRQTIEAEYAEGSRKSKTGALQYLVRSQAYGWRWNTARQLKKSGVIMEEFENLTVQQLASMSNQEVKEMIDWDKLEEYKDSLLAMGMSKRDTRQMIAQQIFGSP